MDEKSRYVIGLDVGTENVRAVVATLGEKTLNVVGYGEAQNKGMRKGIVANLAGPAEAIDKMLGTVERMSGYEVNNAYVAINGSHLLSTKVEGMIAMGAMEHEIEPADLQRVEDAAVTGRVPANRDILDLVPLEYRLDGQGGIKDPTGMTGSRLELSANVISGLVPNCDSLKKATENAGVRAEKLIPSAVAAARAVLSDRQRENGVAVINVGAATTGVAVFEEGELQHVAVIPMGANNITNDLAIMLEVDIEVAETLKRKFATGGEVPENAKPIVLKYEHSNLRFEREQIDGVVKARLTDMFERVQKVLKAAGYDKKLPEGVVLTGGGAHIKDLEVMAHKVLGAAARVASPEESLGGVADAVMKPEYATAVGLALMAADNFGIMEIAAKKSAKTGGLLKKFFKKF